MSAQPPDPGKQGWKPTASTIGGAGIGGAVAQLLTAGIEQFYHVALSSQTASALTVVCVGMIGYFFPDGGRK